MPPLQRYVSQELTHFVGSKLKGNPDGQYDLLTKILRQGLLRSPMFRVDDYFSPSAEGGVPEDLERWEVNQDEPVSSNNRYLAAMVCFCDIPLEDLPIHMSKYSPFGLSFLKEYLAPKGASPVFYIAHTVEKDADYDDGVGAFSKALQTFRRQAGQKANSDGGFDLTDLERAVWGHDWFLERKVFNFMKFFDASLPDDNEVNYYMEREWRALAMVRFDLAEVRRVILPSTYARRFREDFPGYFGQLSFSD